MQIKVLIFGSLIDVVGMQEILLTDVTDSADLEQKLINNHPAMKEQKYAISINHEIIKRETALQENDEVAIIPPFQGG